MIAALRKYGWSTNSQGSYAGSTDLHREAERVVSEFLGVEDCLIYGMGFATNSLTIPLLMGKGCLVLSDEFNHKSIVEGIRHSGSKVKVFNHNDMTHLEQLLRSSIAHGQPRTRRPWKKVVIIVEGIYSMEGEFCPLNEVVALKKKYKVRIRSRGARPAARFDLRGKLTHESLGRHTCTSTRRTPSGPSARRGGACASTSGSTRGTST